MEQVNGAEFTPANWRIAVFLLDDHEVFRRGLRDLLAAEPDIDVIGEAGSVAAALQRLPLLRPDVAVLDVRLPDGGDGVSVCREIRSALPRTVCLMLTAYADDQAALGAILAGAQGYMLKQACGADLVRAVRTVASGHSMLDTSTTHMLMARVRDRMATADPMSALTGQEARVLELIAEGLTNRQIAGRMSLAEGTMKSQVSSLLGKLGMRRRTQAADFAARYRGEWSRGLPPRHAYGAARVPGGS
jgi:DNA-binding NarL/FixJ family response regulator